MQEEEEEEFHEMQLIDFRKSNDTAKKTEGKEEERATEKKDTDDHDEDHQTDNSDTSEQDGAASDDVNQPTDAIDPPDDNPPRSAPASVPSTHVHRGGKRAGKTNHMMRRDKKRHSAEETGRIRDPSLRRMARRSGIVRMSGSTYDNIRKYIDSFLEKICGSAVVMAEGAKRRIITVDDMRYAVERHGKKVYGYGY